ncbi:MULTISPECIES: DUF948 domain-containing protein [unclassified Streptomyces]|uniref:DUF948 domain-containing protein n=1 Tax=Streptomycetaceae TaxID=2062 RepID=UPI002E784FD9|nr:MULTISPECIES: DUF948 domain-containing protein [unclassified Streptomyces]MED7950898.1 DUF948 domain-containing protein [Streptomyces sp. BE303]MEE1826053.1 DUF948 domain-containing protein [Streptomyces sp. BE20]
MSVGELAGLLVAVFWAVLVTLLAVVLVRLSRVLKEATVLVSAVTEQAVPLLTDAGAAVRSANEQLERVDEITANVQDAAANANALSSTVAATLGGPLVKVAAFSYGVRKAVAKQQGGPVLPTQPSEREELARLIRAEVRAATVPKSGLLARVRRAVRS